MTRIFIALSYLILSVYGYQAIKSSFASRWFRYFYYVMTVGVLCYFSVEVLINLGRIWYDSDKLLAFATFLAFYILVMILAAVMFVEDLSRLLVLLYRRSKEGSQVRHLPSRRKTIGKLALLIGALPFGGLLYSIFEGRYNFKVLKYELEFDDLPDAFDGYTITQFSDVHAGGLDNFDKVSYAVDLMNEAKSDIIFFTGDFVDRKSDELLKWVPLFSKLKAKDGMFSILGNHDYGDYYKWESDTEQKADLEALKRLQSKIGFILLCDENRVIQREGDKITIVGSENWSANSMQMRKGDIDKALSGVNSRDFKIVLTHDPTHWEEILIHHNYHFHLTLSGHTHGYQFGLELPGIIKWTPFPRSSFKYWAGLYKEKGQFINVNRGFGYTGFPGRLGIWPEISVFTLRKRKVS